MHACFVDEAGDLGALGNPPLPNDQPVLAIGGLFVDVANLASLTDKFLKSRYGQQLQALQYRYRHPVTYRYEGGLVVSDAIGRRSGSLMFR